MTIKDLEPKGVWRNFDALSQIPRPSKHEEKAEQFLLDWGKEHNVDVRRDETGNIIFSKPATPGYENRRGVILQAHVDMVPQKTAETVHDFLKDPIQTQIDGEWVTARVLPSEPTTESEYVLHLPFLRTIPSNTAL